MEDQTGSQLERMLVNDLSESLKTGVKFFYEKDNKKADWMFYMVVAQGLYERIKDNETYKALSSKELNEQIVPNICDLLKSAEKLALTDQKTHEMVSTMAKRDTNINEGIVNVLPNFPSSFNNYIPFRDYVIGTLLLSSDNQRFELNSIEPVVLDLYDVLSSGQTFINSNGGNKNIELVLHRKDGYDHVYRGGQVRRQKSIDPSGSLDRPADNFE